MVPAGKLTVADTAAIVSRLSVLCVLYTTRMSVVRVCEWAEARRQRRVSVRNEYRKRKGRCAVSMPYRYPLNHLIITVIKLIGVQ